jgi:hypothetical protein
MLHGLLLFLATDNLEAASNRGLLTNHRFPRMSWLWFRENIQDN